MSQDIDMAAAQANAAAIQANIVNLAKPSARYRRSAWLACAGLALFVALYLSLAGWFAWAAYRAFFILLPEGENSAFEVVTGAMAAFMAFFMLKALVFIKRGASSGLVEVTASEQPELFSFLYEIADGVAAPRPHKVFLSPRVNAAVFYDLSLLGFLIPTKKNLEIGLGLVNVLSMGEFRAVLAHEFGHFAQRSMAVGRWVYIAQQIAGHLVARRDWLDNLLSSLSRSDLRIAWVGWIIGIAIWAVRALIDWAFTLLVRVERTLSREMEFNADLVAVSLTGSDALINGLHCLQGADDAWDRAADFAMKERERARLVTDVFALQTCIRDRIGAIRDEPFFGKSPPVPVNEPANYRLFRAEAAQPPRMWMTHPFNHEREANAKRTYYAAEIDPRRAWEVFRDSAKLREQVTANMLAPPPEKATLIPTNETIKEINRQFSLVHLDPRYQGVYFGRSLTRHVADCSALYAEKSELQGVTLDTLYPDSLREDVRQLRSLDLELAQLKGIESGALKLDTGVIWRNGKRLQPQEVKDQLAITRGERDAVSARLFHHDMLVRGQALAEAEKVGEGWPEALKGLLSFIHYGEHGEANLRDVQQVFWLTVRMETATRKLSGAGRKRIIAAGSQLYTVLDRIYRNADQGVLGSDLQAALSASSLRAMFGEFKLNPPTSDNLSGWIDVVDSWINQAAGICNTLNGSALDLLLKYEEALRCHALDGTSPGQAPTVSRPPEFDQLLAGQERKRPERLSWWARFQLGDGRAAGAARFAVALGIVGCIFVVIEAPGGQLTMLVVFNGLDRDVTVELNNERTVVAARSSRLVALPKAWTDDAPDRHHPIGDHRIITRTVEGDEIEQVTPAFNEVGFKQVYNIAAAMPLLEWTAIYGNTYGRQPPAPKVVSDQRFFATPIAYTFTPPPQTMSVTRGGSTSVEVIDAPRNAGPSALLSAVTTPEARESMIRAHARWDKLGSSAASEWLYYAARLRTY